MKYPVKQIFSALILVILLGFFGYYIYHHISDFAQLKLTNPWLIVVLGMLVLVNSTLIGMQIDGFVSALGIKLRFKEWFGLSVVNSFYNIITPFRGGIAVRAVYLKKKHKLGYTSFLSAFAGTYVITFLIASFLGIISLAMIYYNYGILNWLVSGIFALCFIPLLFVVMLSPKFPEAKNKWIDKFIKVLNGWHLISSNRRIVIVVSAATISQILIGAFNGIIAYHIFGISLSFSKALFLACFQSLSLLVSITPAGLGINEAVAVFTALIIGITPAQSLSVAILNRAVTMLVIFTLGPIFSYILLKKERK